MQHQVVASTAPGCTVVERGCSITPQGGEGGQETNKGQAEAVDLSSHKDCKGQEQDHNLQQAPAQSMCLTRVEASCFQAARPAPGNIPHQTSSYLENGLEPLVADEPSGDGCWCQVSVSESALR